MSDEGLENNRRVLRTCLKIYNSYVDLEFDLRLDGDNETADELANKIKKLEKRIRKLRGRMMDDWYAAVPTLREDLRAMHRDIQDAIEDIQDDLDKAQKVAAALGYIDDVVGLLAGVLV